MLRIFLLWVSRLAAVYKRTLVEVLVPLWISREAASNFSLGLKEMGIFLIFGAREGTPNFLGLFKLFDSFSKILPKKKGAKGNIIGVAAEGLVVRTQSWFY